MATNRSKPNQPSKEELMRNLAKDLLNINDEVDGATPGQIYRHFFDSAFESDTKKCLKKKSISTLWDPISRWLGFSIWNRWTLLIVLSVWISLQTSIYHAKPMKYWQKWKTEKCLVDIPERMETFTRPYYDCNRCSHLKSVPIETSMDKEKFAKKYAYTGVPVLIKGAVKQWPATNTFSFQFFKELYSNYSDAFQVQSKEGQFFGYNTEFTDLSDALLMDRYRYKQPWYFGWSNNHAQVQEVLRQHYVRPDFIPEESEASTIDWMFMGKPGKGAHMHLDAVQAPSWQAQIKGRKTWLLQPVPECFDVCPKMNVTVDTGDIFVVNTNIWYHATEIHPGDLSITIGSEYD